MSNSVVYFDEVFLEKLRNTYLTAKAFYETMKSLTEEIQIKVLKENKFYSDPEKAYLCEEPVHRILTIFDTCMMSDDDLQKYIDLTYEEYLKAGIADEHGKEYLPISKPKELLNEAENQLIDYIVDILVTGYEENKALKESKRLLKYRNKLLEIALNL